MLSYFRVPLATAILIGGAALASSPAAAAPISASDGAAQSANVSVRAVAIQQGQTLTLFQTLDGTYQGQGTLEVFCRASNGLNLGEIDGSEVKITINPASPGLTASMFT